MTAEALAVGGHVFTPSFVRSDNRTQEGREAMSQDRQTNDCWGERAVHWLRQRYVNWPYKAIARDLEEPESVIRSWWTGGRPSRDKLQKLTRKFAKDGFSSFVFGAPSREEVTARLEALNNNLRELREILNANQGMAGTSMRVVGRKT